MKRSKYSDSEIMSILKQASSGVPNSTFKVFQSISKDQVGMVFTGGDVSDKTAEFNTAWNSYFTAISS